MLLSVCFLGLVFDIAISSLPSITHWPKKEFKGLLPHITDPAQDQVLQTIAGTDHYSSNTIDASQNGNITLDNNTTNTNSNASTNKSVVIQFVSALWFTMCSLHGYSNNKTKYSFHPIVHHFRLPHPRQHHHPTSANISRHHRSMLQGKV